jgi:hypothetical protein
MTAIFQNGAAAFIPGYGGGTAADFHRIPKSLFVKKYCDWRILSIWRMASHKI